LKYSERSSLLAMAVVMIKESLKEYLYLVVTSITDKIVFPLDTTISQVNRSLIISFAF